MSTVPMTSTSLADPALVERYGDPAPRYTSYPPVPVWTSSFGEGDLCAALEQANREAASPLSVYVHVPFCRKLCLFCGCSVIVAPRRGREEGYLELVEHEVALWAAHLPDRRTVDQVHWGGGTPTYLTPPQLERLFHAIFGPFELAPDAEVSVEVDPRVTSVEHLQTLRGLGFGRLSMGVQDLDPQVQQTVARQFGPAEVARFIDECRRAGFESINVDLMYGLPGQTLGTFSATIGKIVEMRPDRLAVFGYAHVPWMLKHQRALESNAAGAPSIPQEWDRYQLLMRAQELLCEAGYRPIGLDHYGWPEDELVVALETGSLHRNFQGYSTRAGRDLIGFGVTAISEIAGVYAQNHKELPQYRQRIADGRLATARGLALTAEDQLRRDVIMTLLCYGRLVPAEIEQRYGLVFAERSAPELARLESFRRDGLVELSADEVLITPLGRPFLRLVAAVFDATYSPARRMSKSV